MPLPTLVKTYEFDINNIVPGVGSGAQYDGTPERKQMLYEIVTAMINGGTFTVPWTVVGSSDSVNSSMDGTNRWLSSANVVWAQRNDTNPHSWIVLANAGLGIQLLINLETNAQVEGGAIGMWVSKTGFGVANGGTDGSITVQPTAVDQAEIRNEFDNNDGSWSGVTNGTARQFVWHIIASDDGEVWNVAIHHNNALVGCWRFEVPENYPANWSSPLVCFAFGHNSDSDVDTNGFLGMSNDGQIAAIDDVRRGSRAGQSNFGSLNNSQRTPVRPFTWGWGASFNMGHGQLTTVHPLTGNPMLFPIWWWTPADGMGDGRLGRANDLWLKQSTVGGSVGDTYPSNPATPQFIVIGSNLILPWDGATAPITS